MNRAAPAVNASQPIAEWRPERRLPRDMLPIAEIAPGAQISRQAQGRSLDVALDMLLDALPADPAGAALRDKALLAGQRAMTLPAVMLGKTEGGLTTLAIGGIRIALALPAGLAANEIVHLRLLAAGSAALAGTQSAPATQLGAAAQLIARLLAETRPAGPIRSSAPLVAVPADTGRLAFRLQETFRQSGLFYESHLADWVEGSGSKSQLLREPQAAFAGAQSNQVSLREAAPGAGASRLSPHAEALVLRQLDVLEQRSAAWQGPVWPGQEAEIRISQEERNDSSDAERTWQATLTLSFAGLGLIQARIALRGEHASLSLQANDPEAKPALHAGRSEFSRALAAQGLKLTDAAVSSAPGHDAKPGAEHAANA